MKHGWLRLLAVLLAFALVAAACGGDDDSGESGAPAADDSSDDTTDAPDEPTEDAEPADGDAATDDGDDGAAATDDDADGAADETGADDGAADDEPATIDRTGEVIKIGYVNNEGGAISLPGPIQTAEIAVDALNARGGINGATIELFTCMSDGFPEGAINCANELIEADIDVALMGIELASDASVEIWAEAGIPYITPVAFGEIEKSHPNVVVLGAALGSYAVAPAIVFSDLGLSKVAVMNEDIDTAAGFYEEVLTPIFGNYGLEPIEVTLEQGAPNWAAGVATAQANGAEAIYTGGDDTACIGLVSAANAAGFEGPIFAASCAFYYTVLGEAALGTYSHAGAWALDTYQFAPPDVQEVFDMAIADIEGSGNGDLLQGPLAPISAGAYGSWLDVAVVLETIEGEMSSEAILQAFKTSESSRGHMGPDFACASASWSIEPSACHSSIMVFQVQQLDDGTIARVPIWDEFRDASELAGL